MKTKQKRKQAHAVLRREGEKNEREKDVYIALFRCSEAKRKLNK